jgi:methylated-DNA-[protein]-cysteine S-methyltransferase
MTQTTYYCTYESPLGTIMLVGEESALTGLYLPQHKHWAGLDAACQCSTESFAEVRRQLDEYFAGERQAFDLPYKLHGTSFQQQVWQELGRIPFGTTITYAELARRIGMPKAQRAVGAANGRNPVSIIVPCHRVIGSQGKLTGYGGGVDKKEWLLRWEKERSGQAAPELFANQEA